MASGQRSWRQLLPPSRAHRFIRAAAAATDEGLASWMMADLQYVRWVLVRAIDKGNPRTGVTLGAGQLQPLLDRVTAAIDDHC